MPDKGDTMKVFLAVLRHLLVTADAHSSWPAELDLTNTEIMEELAEP